MGLLEQHDQLIRKKIATMPQGKEAGLAAILATAGIRSAVLASEKSLAAYLRPQYQGTHIPNSCGFGLRTQVGSMSTRSCNL